jgi:hypothetical protein
MLHMNVEKQVCSGWDKSVHLASSGSKGQGRDVGLLAGKEVYCSWDSNLS